MNRGTTNEFHRFVTLILYLRNFSWELLCTIQNLGSQCSTFSQAAFDSDVESSDICFIYFILILFRILHCYDVLLTTLVTAFYK